MSFKNSFAAKVLNRGGIISNPTDTIQGLTCLPKFDESICRMIYLKRRLAVEGFILLASDTCYVARYVANPSLLKNICLWSEPTTYLLKANQYASKLLTGKFDTIAIRLTNHPLITDLCKRTNSALVSTSANVSNKNCATSMLDLFVFFANQLDFVITPTTNNNKASKIINLDTGENIR